MFLNSEGYVRIFRDKFLKILKIFEIRILEILISISIKFFFLI